MERLKDFDSFYEQKLAPLLKDLRLQSERSRTWGGVAIASAVTMLISFGIYLTSELPDMSGWIALISLILLIVSIYRYTLQRDNYVDDFKEKVIRQIVNYLLPDVVYKPSSFVASKEYKVSGLFRQKYSHIDGDDYLQGIYKGVKFHCSELHTEYEATPQGGLETIFKGLFFVAEPASGFYGGTYVWTKGDEQLPRSMADEHFRMYNLPAVSRLYTGRPEFDKQYSVYSTDVSEAAAIVTPTMMELMVNFKKQLQRDVVYSFVGGRCYVAIPITENLLEPGPDLEDREAIKEYFFTILLVLSIINQLHLDNL